MMGRHHRLGQTSRIKDLDDDLLQLLAQAARTPDPEARGNHILQGVPFTVFLPLDPRSHAVVGTGFDTIGDIIGRLAPDRWNETQVVITMEAPGSWEEVGIGSTLYWSDRVLDTVAPGAIITVSLPLRAQAAPWETHNGLDPTLTVSRTLRQLQGSLVEALNPASTERLRGKLPVTYRKDASPLRSAWIHEQALPGTLAITALQPRTLRGPHVGLMTAHPIRHILCHLKGHLVEISFSAPIAGRGGKPSTIMVPNSASPRDLSRALLLGDPLTTPEYYLVLNGKVLSRSLLTQPLYATPHDVAGYCLQLRYRLRGGMQGQGGAGIGPRGDVHMNSATSGSSPALGAANVASEADPTTNPTIEWLMLTRQFADLMGVSGEEIADGLDPGLDKYVSPAQRREILCDYPGGTASLRLSLQERILALQTSLRDPWMALFSNTFDSEALDGGCPLAASFIKDTLTPALRSRLFHANRIDRLMHTGSGDVLQIDKEDRETVMIVSGFTNQQSLLEYLGSLGFEPVNIRSKTGPKTDLFIPHSGPPGDSVARGHCHVAVKRTETAIRLLEEFYRGERSFAPTIEPPDSGMISVNRNTRFHYPDGTLFEAPIMILEPPDDREALKFQLIVRLLTTLGLSSDDFCTLLVTILRLGGRDVGGVAEIRPDPPRSLADVFDRSFKGIGRLRVFYSPHHGFDSTKTPITFDLSACILRCCNATVTQSEVLMELPELLQPLTFTLLLQKKDVLTDRERASTASTVLRPNLGDLQQFLVTHHNRCHLGLQDALISDFPSPEVLEDWLANHVITFLQRLVPTSFSHHLNSDTVRVEITTGRENKIGRGSQILIHLYSQEGRLPFTPHVATTLALQLGLLVAHRPEACDSFTGLQWDPLMSLIPGYPFLRDLYPQRCELDRVTWMTPELTTGSSSFASGPITAFRPRFNLPGPRAYTISPLQIKRNRFLTHLLRLFTRDSGGPTLSPPNIVLFADAQSLRSQKARERAEEGIEARDSNDHRTKCLDAYPVLLAPSVLTTMQSTRIRNIPGLVSFNKMDATIRASYGNPGEARRQAHGAQMISQLLSQGEVGPFSWITYSPESWFDIEWLHFFCPMVKVLLDPNREQMEQIKHSDAIQAPFCLQCHNCYEIGVYDPKKFVSHCLHCLLKVLGYAAADRFAQCIVNLSRIATAHEAQGAQQGTALSAAGHECAEQILSLLPHPLPHLLADSVQPRRDDSDFRHRDFVGQYVQEFLQKTEHLAAILTGASHPLQNEAILWYWGLGTALGQDVQDLMSLLIRFPNQARLRSQANTLHAVTWQDQPQPGTHLGESMNEEDRTAPAGSRAQAHMDHYAKLPRAAPRDTRMGVRDPRPHSRLPRSGPVLDSSKLPQRSAMPPGPSSTPPARPVPAAPS